jgi:hypothetical protein
LASGKLIAAGSNFTTADREPQHAGRLNLRSVATLLTLAIAFATRAPAHEWYPMQCCSGDDRAPVDKVEVLTEQHEVAKNKTLANLLGMPAHASVPPLLVTTKHGRVIVPPDFP